MLHVTTTRAQGMTCAVAAIGLVLTGCATQPDRDTSLPGAQETGTGMPDCSLEPTDHVTAELASHCVYKGWLANDERLIEAYGAPDVTSSLPFAGDGASFDFKDCSPSDGPIDPVVCTWTTEAVSGDGTEGIFVMRMHVGVETEADGYRVNKIELEPPS